MDSSCSLRRDNEATLPQYELLSKQNNFPLSADELHLSIKSIQQKCILIATRWTVSIALHSNKRLTEKA